MISAADYSLQRMVMLSAAGHAAILFFFTVTTYIISPAEVILPQAIRVDVVGLPQKNQENQPILPKQEKAEPVKPKAKLPPKEAAAPPKTEAPSMPSPKAKAADDKKKKDKRMQDVLNDLRRQQAMEKIREDNKAAQQAADAKKAATLFGQKVSEGNAHTGATELIDFNKYLAELQARLNANFEIPQWLADSDLSAAVLIQIDQRGYVTKKTMTKSSGNPAFDTVVMGTIEKASPMPPPPDSLRGRLATSGITVKFPN